MIRKILTNKAIILTDGAKQLVLYEFFRHHRQETYRFLPWIHTHQLKIAFCDPYSYGRDLHASTDQLAVLQAVFLLVLGDLFVQVDGVVGGVRHVILGGPVVGGLPQGTCQGPPVVDVCPLGWNSFFHSSN